MRFALSSAAMACAMLITASAGAASPAHPTEGQCVTLTRGFWMDVFGGRNAEAARKYITNDYIQHSPPPQPTGEEWIAVWKGVFADPPYGPGRDFDESQKDFKTVITKIIGDDNFAVLTAHDTGTYDHGPNKGKTFDSRYTDIFRCADGKVVEHWYSPDP